MKHLKKVLIFIGICAVISCSKEETQNCDTCTVNVTYQDGYNHTTQNYIESQTEYCNNEADTIKQGIISAKKVSHDGGDNWVTTTKTRSCK